MTTILLVDDYAPNHRLMRFVLEQSGYAMVSAFDGRQALDQLLSASIDLIVTDLAMPSMDGLALAREVRGDARYTLMPIMVITASGSRRDQATAADIGVNAFLTKPVDSAEIVYEINRLMAGSISLAAA